MIKYDGPTKQINSQTVAERMISKHLQQSADDVERTYRARIVTAYLPHEKLPDDNTGRNKEFNPNNIHCTIQLNDKNSSLRQSNIQGVLFPIEENPHVLGLIYGSDDYALKPCRFICRLFNPAGSGRVELTPGLNHKKNSKEAKQEPNNKKMLVAARLDIIGPIMGTG